MKTLASRIQHELQVGEGQHYAAYEDELQRIWPLDEKDRKAKIAQFAKEGGFCLSFYKKGLCAIFENNPMVAKWMQPPVARIQDRRNGGYSIRSTLNRIEIGLATARRWQTIAKTTSSAASARCLPNDEGLFALLHVAGIVSESQMAEDAAI
jgi:hypothetical protein